VFPSLTGERALAASFHRAINAAISGDLEKKKERLQQMADEKYPNFVRESENHPTSGEPGLESASRQRSLLQIVNQVMSPHLDNDHEVLVYNDGSGAVDFRTRGIFAKYDRIATRMFQKPLHELFMTKAPPVSAARWTPNEPAASDSADVSVSIQSIAPAWGY